MRRALRPFAVATTVVAASLFSISTAQALDDCPPGSTSMSEDGFSWCQPTVCANDGQCKPNEVCRPLALCLEVGTLADAGSAGGGKRLVVTQPCVAGREPGDPKTCPQKQTCSDISRCVTKASAEKLGILTVPSAAPAAPETTGGTAKKSACGCGVVGVTGPGGAVSFALAMMLAAARRRQRE